MYILRALIACFSVASKENLDQSVIPLILWECFTTILPVLGASLVGENGISSLFDLPFLLPVWAHL